MIYRIAATWEGQRVIIRQKGMESYAVHVPYASHAVGDYFYPCNENDRFLEHVKRRGYTDITLEPLT